MIQVLDELMDKYEKKFNEDIELDAFIKLDDDEKIKILEMCLKNNERIYENDYFNDWYMEEVVDQKELSG